MASQLRGILPSALKLGEQEPVGPPKVILKGGVIGAKPGPWAVWETSFRLGDGSPESRSCEELNRTDTPKKAYEYWSTLMLRNTAFGEWKGHPVIVCLPRSKDGYEFSALEVAHYIAAILENRPAWCLRCGTMFVPKRSDAEYCSDTCRWADQKAKQRRKQKKRAKAAQTLEQLELLRSAATE
jgi:hypothetical protein